MYKQETNVLIIMDQARLPLTLHTAALLRSEGLSVVIAKDCQDALRIVRRGGLRLVITEIMMIDMNGLELLDAIRGLATPEQLPVIILTAWPNDHKVPAWLKTTKCYWLFNPYHKDRLLGVVKNAIG